MKRRHGQVSVLLDSELRQFVERAPSREDRTIAGLIRHCVAQAARAGGVDDSERKRKHPQSHLS